MRSNAKTLVRPGPNGTVMLGDRQLTCQQVAALCAALLTAAKDSTEAAGQTEQSKSQKPLGDIAGAQPGMIQVRSIDGQPTPWLVLSYGHAHLGVAVPRATLLRLATDLKDLLSGDKAVN